MELARSLSAAGLARLGRGEEVQGSSFWGASTAHSTTTVVSPDAMAVLVGRLSHPCPLHTLAKPRATWGGLTAISIPGGRRVQSEVLISSAWEA